MYAFGGQLYDPETLEVTLDHPGNVAAFEWLADYYQEFEITALALPSGLGDLASPYNPFYRGQSHARGRSVGGPFHQPLRARPELGVTYFPAPAGGRPEVTPCRARSGRARAATNAEAAVDSCMADSAGAVGALRGCTGQHPTTSGRAGVCPRSPKRSTSVCRSTSTCCWKVRLHATWPAVGLYLSETAQPALAAVQDGTQRTGRPRPRSVTWLRELEKYD